mmetsp:Transcript_18541/g.17626  ORF Transcript_18541/g.17626 Transcript_18541/m.17626 type:complete len:87 (+) Transcript_18541:2445-2705(+)
MRSSGGNTKRTFFDEKNNLLSISNPNIEQNFSEDDDDEVIVIKLMANMFSKKKSVREKILMDREISVEEIKKEIKWRYLKLNQQVI